MPESLPSHAKKTVERAEPRRQRRLALLVPVALLVGLVASIARSQQPVAPPPAVGPAASVAPLASGSSSSAVSAPPAPGEVPFDHTIHAGKYEIPCIDCHAYADKSAVAGLPSGRKCMGCHKFIDKDKPGVQRLASRFAAGESLEWQRVFYLPDYIYFSHRMHIRADVACADCHGDVAAMKTVTQDRPFTMGRCLTCHEQRHASRDCITCHK